MDFVSIRIITGDVARLVDFYERVTGVPATWSTEDFAELRTAPPPSRSPSTRTVAAVRPGLRPPGGQPQPSSSSSSSTTWTASTGPAGSSPTSSTEPTTMPWGNRSLLFRDPDGNLVNFFTPVTPAAIAKFAAVRGPH